MEDTPSGFTKARRVGLCCSSFMFVIGLVLATCGTIIIDAVIRSLLPMRSTQSLLFEVWQDSQNKAVPLRRNFFVWNLTNPFEVYRREASPNFVKIGPYVYREHLEAPMDSISWSTNSESIDFEYTSTMTWDADASIDAATGRVLHPNDTFTTLNLALWSAAYRVNLFPVDGDPLNALVKGAACDMMQLIVNNTVVGRNGFFIERPVEAYLFGFEDDIWKSLQETTVLIDYHNPSIFRSVFNGSQPAPSPYTYRSGATCPIWDNQSACNSSGASRSTIYSGVGDVSKVAQYSQWSGQESLWWWPKTGTPGESCQVLQGSNAMNFPPGLTEDDTPYVFVDSIFRTVKLQFTQYYTVNDVPTLQFRVSDDEKRVGNPNSNCYQQRYPSTFNMSSPYFAPMIVSQPYYWGVPNPKTVFVDEPDLPYGQSSTMLNFTIGGVHVNDYISSLPSDDAELVLRVEPHTGTLLEGHGRIQLGTWMRPINVAGCSNFFPQLQPESDGNGTSYFPYTMIPILYLDRTVVAPESLTSKLYDLVVLPILLSKIIGGVLAAVSAAGFVATMILIKYYPVAARIPHTEERARLIQVF